MELKNKNVYYQVVLKSKNLKNDNNQIDLFNSNDFFNYFEL